MRTHSSQPVQSQGDTFAGSQDHHHGVASNHQAIPPLYEQYTSTNMKTQPLKNRQILSQKNQTCMIQDVLKIAKSIRDLHQIFIKHP